MKFYKYLVLKNKSSIFLLIVWFITLSFFFYSDSKKKKYNEIFLSTIDLEYDKKFNNTIFFSKYEEFINNFFINHFNSIYPQPENLLPAYNPLQIIKESITSEKEKREWFLKNDQFNCRLEIGSGLYREFLIVSETKNLDFCKKTFMKVMEKKFILLDERFNEYQDMKLKKIIEIKNNKKPQNFSIESYKKRLKNSNITDKLIYKYHEDIKNHYEDFINNYISGARIISESRLEIFSKTENVNLLLRFKFTIFFLFLPLYFFIIKFIFTNKNN